MAVNEFQAENGCGMSSQTPNIPVVFEPYVLNDAFNRANFPPCCGRTNYAAWIKWSHRETSRKADGLGAAQVSPRAAFYPGNIVPLPPVH